MSANVIYIQLGLNAIALNKNAYDLALASATTDARAYANSAVSAAQAAQTDADFAAASMANLGMTVAVIGQDAYDALLPAYTNYLASVGVENRGVVVVQLATIVAGLTTDATYGTAAKNLVAAYSSALAYSTDVTSTLDKIISVIPAPLALTLTTGVDTPAMTSVNDVITGSTSTTASANTFGPLDVINGGDGTDTLKLSLGKDSTGFTDGSLKSVEIIEATNTISAARSMDLTGATGVTNLVINANSQNFTVDGLAAPGVDVQLNGLSGSIARTVTINHAATSTLGTADGITFGLNGLGVAKVTSATGVTTTAEVAVTIDAANIETVNLVATGAPNVVDVATGASTAMNISGSGSLKINAVDATLAAVDASKASGALTLNLTAGAIKSYAGGSGVDGVTVGASIAANLTATGGEGADTLTFDTLGAGQTIRPTVSGFETISLKTNTNSATIAADKMTDVATIRIVDDIATTKTTTVAGLSSKNVSIVQSEALAATFGAGDGTLAYTGASAVALSTTTANTAQATFATDFTLAAAESVALSVGAKTKYTGDITANVATGVTVTIQNGTAAAASEFSGKITSTSATSVKVDNQEDATALVLTTVTKGATTLDVTSASAVTFAAASNLEKVGKATFVGDKTVDTTGATTGVLGAKAASVAVDASQVLGAVTTTIGAYTTLGGSATVIGSELGANTVVIESGRTDVAVTGGISDDTVTLNSVLTSADAGTISINLGTVSLADTLILAGDAKAAVAHDWSSSTVTLSGVNVLDSSAVAGSTLTAKAATFTGQTLKINEDITAVTLKGTSAADAINISKITQGDATKTTITIDGSAGADTITLATTEGIVINASTGAKSSSAAMDTITGVTSAALVDTLKVVLANKGTEVGVTLGVLTATALTAQTSLEAYLNAAAAGDGSTNGIVNWFQYGGNTYLTQDLSAGASFVAGTDIVVKFTGTVDLLGTTGLLVDFA